MPRLFYGEEIGYIAILPWQQFPWQQSALPLLEWYTVIFGTIHASILQWGFGLLVGIKYTLTVQAAFFLILGLGVDDTFVIMVVTDL